MSSSFASVAKYSKTFSAELRSLILFSYLQALSRLFRILQLRSDMSLRADSLEKCSLASV